VRVLVVVPTYNEAENVERMLDGIHAALPEAGILVVDDGSPDGTADLVETAAKALPDVHVLRRSAKSGLGSAYRAGFRWGLERGYDACVEMDADFSHDPAALPGLVAPLSDGYEVSIGSRYVAGGSIPDWSWHRHLLSWGGNRYATVVLGLAVADSTAGFRAYAASVLRRIDLDEVRAEGYGFQIEMTYRAKQHGAAITEVIFGRAGLGSYLATAITSKNIPVVQGAVVLIGIGYVVINLAVDLIVGTVDPRARIA